MIILFAWLLADFLAGIIHWIEDKIFTETTMHVFSDLNADNTLHHAKPAAMLSYSYWGNISTSAIFTLPLTALLWYFNAPQIFTLAIFFSTFGNLVHRFAHTPPRKIPLWIKFMQKIGLFISPAHHGTHHYQIKKRSVTKILSKAEAYERYCPMTNWLNPILDGIKFWNFLEYLFQPRSKRDEKFKTRL